jgi:hypothetical protein
MYWEKMKCIELANPPSFSDLEEGIDQKYVKNPKTVGYLHYRRSAYCTTQE